MGASGAKYGIMTSHFYWVGAIPAMVFVGVFMMPFYYGSRARSVPEYLRLRFDEKTRALQRRLVRRDDGVLVRASRCTRWASCSSCCSAGASTSASSSRRVIVLAYILLGGLTSAIYNEVLQFFLIVFGFAPLVALGLHDVGGWDGLTARLAAVATCAGCPPAPTPTPGAHGRRRRRTRWASSGSAWSMGLGLRPVVRLLVHRLPRRPAGHGRRLDDRGAAHAADRRGSRRCSSRSW